ncbi:LacI family DNA-binding transcriptional regulator [Candidatus Solirubrobacter pratensis]|uniref:LacI family DNA-binding transcriptional regulator n=1 Tax=Candidatus Solirubrobacter pratensis TaxID=1298857 RepID=UPI0003F894C4|nr:LacI family DNA-binding transcriptional regulator [Candidatus Solirubrobacter pratensis]
MSASEAGGPKRATLRVVARAAGVSTATASKVLNHRPDVAEDTRRRVEAALREHGYEPTTGPRGPRADQVVSLVLDTLENTYSTQVLRGVLAAAQEMEMGVMVEELCPVDRARDDDPGARLTPAWIRTAVRRRRFGVLAVTTALQPAQVRTFARAGLPLVAIDPPSSDGSVVGVASTNFTGGEEAAKHLVELGHRRIGLAGGPEGSVTARERNHGYRSALETAGILPDEALMLQGAYTYEAGVAMGLELLGRDAPPSAIFAASDLTALGVLEAARQAGLRVPRDLSVVGFDDTPAALWSAPPLTTVRQNMTGLGRVALRTLVELAEGQEPVSHRIELATSLVQRQSTAPPRPVRLASRRRKRMEPAQ